MTSCHFLGEVDTLGVVLKAPLVFMVPYLAELAPIANQAYRGKREAVARAEAEGKWQRCSGCTRSPTE